MFMSFMERSIPDSGPFIEMDGFLIYSFIYLRCDLKNPGRKDCKLILSEAHR